MEKWICKCGAECTTKFCRQCGSQKPAGVEPAAASETPSAQTQPVMPVEQPVQSPSVTPVEQPVQRTNATGAQSATTGGSKLKYIIAAVVCVVLAVGGFFGYGYVQEQRYTEQVNEYIALSEQTMETLEGIKDLTGDVDEDARKVLVEDIKAKSDALKDMQAKIAECKAPKDKTTEQEYIASLIDMQRTSLKKAVDLLSYDKTVIHTQLKRVNAKEFYDLYKAADLDCDENIKSLDKATIDTINGRSIARIFNYKELKELLSKYQMDKESNNTRNYTAQLLKYRQERVAKNEELRKSGEVVFLVDDVEVDADGKLFIGGNFYNGMSTPVGAIKEMTLDVTFKSGSETIAEIKGKKFINIGDMFIAPKSYAPHRNFVTGGASNVGDFDNYDVTVSNVVWQPPVEGIGAPPKVNYRKGAK